MAAKPLFWLHSHLLSKMRYRHLPTRFWPASRVPKALTALIFLGIIIAPAALAIDLPKADADEMFSDKLTVDGKKFIDEMRKRLDTYNDYSVDSAVFMYK